VQITYLDANQCADVIEESKLLTRIEAPGSAVTHVMTRYGVDIIMLTDSVTGESILIEPDWVDQDRGGSIHDQARDVLRDAPSDS
jgi:hypothetical protein